MKRYIRDGVVVYRTANGYIVYGTERKNSEYYSMTRENSRVVADFKDPNLGSIKLGEEIRNMLDEEDEIKDRKSPGCEKWDSREAGGVARG